MIPRPAASATSGGAGGSKLGVSACRDATVTETGWVEQFSNLGIRHLPTNCYKTKKYSACPYLV
nr:MAG TPA: hypothetical protein [Caudoviricetes sp.]